MRQNASFKQSTKHGGVMNVKTNNRYYPTRLDLLQLTGASTINEACAALGITTATYRYWKTKGISERVYNKYWR